ncbi:hypothetical protein P692DRAFT_20743549 [Suillus brevipes Sb2]|nr:hypothetical protein P692DRAFT_20743549 [Suillus brevipes Sb2]
MARHTLHEQYLRSYLTLIVLHILFHPADTVEEAAPQLHCDISCILPSGTTTKCLFFTSLILCNMQPTF